MGGPSETLNARETWPGKGTWRPLGEGVLSRSAFLPPTGEPDARELGLEAEGRLEQSPGEEAETGLREEQSWEMEDWSSLLGGDGTWRRLWEWGGPPLEGGLEGNPVKSPCL